jgi:hypothetical protein
MKKNIKRVIAKCLLRIAECKLVKSKKLMPNNYSLVPNKPVPPNTLTTFPNYLKKPIRFWSTNVGDEIRSTFDLELYCKVCESRGVSSGVETIS